MASLTAVELSAEICALARTSVRRGEVHLHAAETLDPASFPGADSFVTALRQARRTLKLPRRCRAVLWGLPEGAGRHDITVKPLLAPLVAAGFTIDRVVTPCNALAALARLRTSRGENATCWLAINRGGVAIVVVRPGKQLYAHSFTWDSSIGSTGSQARLLQRYSLVSHLSPEVKRAMAVARQHGTPVDAIVTCGNLPDLRSMTMPLIEELDVEVETLDSLEGLVVSKEAADRLADIAPAIRLACAGAVSRGGRRLDEGKRRQGRTDRVLRVAAVLAGFAAVAYAWYARPEIMRPGPAAPAPQAQPAPPVPGRPSPDAANPSAGATPQQIGAARGTGGTAPPPAAAPDPRAAEQRAAEQRAAEQRAAEQRAAEQKAAEQRAAEQKAAEQRAAQQRAAEQRAAEQRAAEQRAAEQRAAQQKAAEQRAAEQKAADQRAAAQKAATVSTSSVPADKPPAGTARAPARRPPPVPLKDPVPRVMTILVSGERRFATIEGGQIIGIGDVVGRRTVVAIEERAVILREPSGLRVRVPLGGRSRGSGRSAP